MSLGLHASWRCSAPLVALAIASASLSAQTTVLFDAQEAELRAADPGSGDLFGQSVDIDGNRAVVAAIFDDNAGGFDAGSVYVFEHVGTTWTQTAKLVASEGAASSYFGYSAALDGDTIVVGAGGDDTPAGQDAGSAYVFALCGGVWVQQAHLFHPNGAPFDQFGFPVAIDGNTIAVGAFTDDTCAADSGSVWVYVRNTQGNGDPCDDTWDLQTAAGLSSPNCQATGGFGVRIDLQGNRLVVGAHQEDSQHVDQGAAYLYERAGSTWTMVAQLPAGNGAAGDAFGVALALQGETALIGAAIDDLPGVTDTGSAYVFRKAGANFVLDQKFNPPEFASGDEFGLLVALDAGTALISARRSDDQAMDAGSVSVVTISKGQFERFGFGDGSSTACPCGNVSGVGLEEGCTNSRLHGGTLSVAGTDSASDDDFRMISWNLIPGNPALLFSGPNRLNSGAGFVFGNGLRLVGGTTVRRGIQAPNADGRAVWGPGLSGTGTWPAGTSVHFQTWYRDPFHGSCGDVFNLTNGVTIRFNP